MSIQKLKNAAHLRLLFQKPGLFWQKIRNRCRILIGEFFIDKTTSGFIKHNRHVWKGWVDTHGSRVVLIDWNILPVWVVPGLFFANVLARKKSARICSFAREQWGWAHATHAVYRSLNVTQHLEMGRLSANQHELRDKIYEEVTGKLKTKEDVFNIKINGIHIGLDIYESYLKEFNKPTVYLDEALLSVVHLAIGYLVFWEDYFNKHEVAGVVISHDAYVDYNIVCRIAYQRKVPVYKPMGPYVSLLKKPHDSENFFYSYKNWFDGFNADEKQQAKELARRQLEKRFKGEVGGELHYAKVSAFSSPGNNPLVIRPSDKIKVLICSHCFYDNPHAYGGMLFIDFYEWLKFLIKIAEKTDYDWYLKTHPQPLPGTMEFIKEILGQSSRITIVPSATSHHQLAREGINFVLTVYGTVGHEYPALGVGVINAGYNPHAGYDFTWTPKNLSEYEHLLFNLKNLKKDITIDEIYEFYYMHYYYCLIEDLVYHSFRDTVKRWTRQQHVSSDVYSFYLNGWDEQRHKRSIRWMEEFIDSGKQHLFIKGPVDVQDSRIQETVYLS